MPNNNVSVQRNGGFPSDTIQNDCLIFITSLCCSTMDLSPDPLPPPPSVVSNHGVGYGDVGGILRSFFTFFLCFPFHHFYRVIRCPEMNGKKTHTHRLLFVSFCCSKNLNDLDLLSIHPSVRGENV